MLLQDRRIRTSLVAIGADLLLTTLKVGLALATGSAALLADAYHSGSDLVVSLVLLASLILRYRQERKGGGLVGARRVEAVLAVLVALIILYVPVEILSELGNHSPEHLSHLWLGIIGVLVVIAIVHFMASLKTHVGRETDSPALEADGFHSKIDLFSSIAVLVSLVGALVGIYLDEIVAVIIAVLIGIAGLELLVSGMRSLLRGDDLDTLSVVDSLALRLSRIPFSHTLLSLSAPLKELYRYARWLVVPVLLAIWLASGVTSIPYGYTGIKERFGATTQQGLAPGLHYVLPWPIERLRAVPSGQILSTTVGSRMELDQAPSTTRLWREIKATQAHEDETSYIPTGDENLLDLEFTVQYRIANPIDLVQHIKNLETTVTRYAESALWQETASRSFADVITHSHHEFSDAVAQRMVTELGDLDVQLEVVSAQVQALQPPAMVVAVYRDLLNAEQEQKQRKNRAEAQRSHDLLMANAERIQQQGLVQSDARDAVLSARGETEHFRELAQVFSEHRDSVHFNRYLQALVVNLGNRRLLITDPSIDSRDLRLWGTEGLVYPEGTK